MRENNLINPIYDLQKGHSQAYVINLMKTVIFKKKVIHENLKTKKHLKENNSNTLITCYLFLF